MYPHTPCLRVLSITDARRKISTGHDLRVSSEGTAN